MRSVLTQPRHHRYGEVGEHRLRRRPHRAPQRDLLAEAVLGLARDGDALVAGLLAEAGRCDPGRASVASGRPARPRRPRAPPSVPSGPGSPRGPPSPPAGPREPRRRAAAPAASRRPVAVICSHDGLLASRRVTRSNHAQSAVMTSPRTAGRPHLLDLGRTARSRSRWKPSRRRAGGALGRHADHGGVRLSGPSARRPIPRRPARPPGCCTSGSSCSARRSTTPSPTGSAPSCCCSPPRTRTATSASTSTRPGGSVSPGLAIYDTHAADPQRRQHAGDGAGGQHGPVPAVGGHAAASATRCRTRGC